MPMFNVEIRATNNYTAGLGVTECPLTLDGGWSEKMPAFVSTGGGSGTALVRNAYFFLNVFFPLLVLLYYMQCWGYEIKGQMEFRYYDAAEPFVLTFSIGGSNAAIATVSPKMVTIPAQIKHAVQAEVYYHVNGRAFNITLDFSLSV